MSRPMTSVPKRCQPLNIGGWFSQRCERWMWATGGVYCGTSAPATKMLVRMNPATTVTGCRRSRRQSGVEANRRGSGRAEAGSAASTTPATSVRLRPWVDERKNDLAQDGSREDDGGAEQQRELQGIDVDLGDAVDVELEQGDEDRPEPSELEDVVDGERPSQEETEVRHERGHERHECVPKRVAKQHDALGEALRARDRDVGRVEGFDEGVAKIAGMHADEDKRESDRGKREVVDHLTDVSEPVSRRRTLEVVRVDPLSVRALARPAD